MGSDQEKGNAQVAWEKSLTLKGADRLCSEGATLLLVNEHEKMAEKKQALEKSFSDKTDKLCRPQVATLDKTKTIVDKMSILSKLSGDLTGCATTKDFATGMDYPFTCVVFSHHHEKHFPYTWDVYVHSSGRCGRRPRQLGLAVIFISSDVRFWCQTVRRGLTLHSVQEDAKKWESTFQELVKKQPSLCDQVGASLRLPLSSVSVLVSNALLCACLLCRCSGSRDFVKVLITH